MRLLLVACGLCVIGCAGEGEESTGSASGGGVSWTTSSTGGNGGAGVGAGGSGANGGSTSTTTGGGSPTVVSVTPTDGTTAVAPDSPITVTFSEAMDATTATVTGTSSCMGSLQLSRDDFSTCVAMASAPATSDDITFTLTPSAGLDSSALYKLRATNTLTSATAASLTPFESSGFTVRYFHTIVIDGTNDFDAVDQQASSTVGAQLLVSFDDTYLYLGLAHADVGGTGNKFVYFLLSTDTSLATGNDTSSDGKAEFGQSGAKMMFHYKEQITGGTYSEYRTANGTDWDTDWGTTGKSSYRATGYLEARIALSELGSNVTDVLVTTYTIDYDGGMGAQGYVYNMLSAATEGGAQNPVDLVQYVHIQLPSEVAGGDAGLLKSF